MANGGIIGPVQVVSTEVDLPEKITPMTASGTFTVQCASAGGTRTGSVLVVGGGGAASPGCRTGGGGAGGFRLLSCQTFVTSGISVTIGGGGVGGSTPDKTGENTIFANPGNPITSAGGGTSIGWVNPGTAGGSGGGGSGYGPIGYGSGGAGNTPPVSPPQGNAGGSGKASPGPGGGGGGGGASAVGANAPPTVGAGGAGSPVTPVFGSAPQPFYLPNVPATGNTACGHFAGGGGGGGCNPTSVPVAGGIGGGGGGFASGTGNGTNARANSGGGGGGNYNTPADYVKGGSGIVLVKEDAVTVTSSSIPGVWSMNSVYEYVKDDNWTN